jgi:hypothetical protein
MATPTRTQMRWDSARYSMHGAAAVDSYSNPSGLHQQLMD